MKSPASICHIALALLVAQSVALGQSTGPITKAELNQNGFPFPSDPPADVTHAELVNYAWRLFIAANNLAGPTRGEAASSNSSFSSTGSSSAASGPLVWETFYHRSEAYPYYDKSGGGQKPAKPSSSTSQAPTYYFETKTVKNGEWNNLDENNEIGQNTLYFPKGSPHPTEPDKDSQVLYQAKVNGNELNYVYPMSSPAPGFSFPTTGAGTIEVKSAWRLAKDIGDTSRYHTAMANYYTGEESNPTVESAEFALLALHIIVKTANHPTFIFATWEQIDSVEDANGTPTGLYYVPSYSLIDYKPAGSSQTPSASYTGAYSTIKPDSFDGIDTTSTTPLPPGGPVPNSTTVIQPKTITADAINASHMVHTNLNSGNVWQYYTLKGVQSLATNTSGTGSQRAGVTTSPDYYLANIVVESSQPGVQLFKGFAPGPKPNMLAGNYYTSSWQTWSASGSAVAGAPAATEVFAVGNTQNNNLEAYLIGTDGTLYHNYYGSSWGSWSSTDSAVSGAPKGTQFFAVGNTQNRNLEAYLIATDNTLYHSYYHSNWSNWSSTDTAVSGAPKGTQFFAVGNTQNKNLEAYLIATDGTLYHSYYDSSWSQWSSTDSAVTGAPKATAFFAVGNSQNNNLEAYLIAQDGTLYHNYYSSQWNGWNSTDTAVSGAPKASSFFAVGNSQNQNLEAYLIAQDGTLYHNYYSSAWNGWNSTDTAVAGAPKATSFFAVGNTQNRNLEAYLISEDGTLYHNYYTTGWQSWNSSDSAVEGAPNANAFFAVGNTQNQNLEAFAIANSVLQPQLAMDNVIAPDGTKVNIGGCMGCHGVAQVLGFDFSFLVKNGLNGPGFKPDTLDEMLSMVELKAETAASDRKVTD